MAFSVQAIRHGNKVFRIFWNNHFSALASTMMPLITWHGASLHQPQPAAVRTIYCTRNHQPAQALWILRSVLYCPFRLTKRHPTVFEENQLNTYDENVCILLHPTFVISRLQCILSPSLPSEAGEMCGQGSQLSGLHPQPQRVSQGLWDWREMLSLQLSQLWGGRPPLLPLQSGAVWHQQPLGWRGPLPLEDRLERTLQSAIHLQPNQKNNREDVKIRENVIFAHFMVSAIRRKEELSEKDEETDWDI